MWRVKLNAVDLFHVENELMHTEQDLMRNIRCQERQDVPCVQCLLIARKLGIVYKLKLGVIDPCPERINHETHDRWTRISNCLEICN